VGSQPNVAVNQQAGTVVLTIPVATDFAPGDQIVISGIKVTLNGKGKTGTSLVAQVSASQGSGINITAGQDRPTVISTVLEGLVDAGVTLPAASTTGAATLAINAGAASLFTNGVVGKGNFTLDITEAFFDAFRALAQQGGGLLAATGVELTFNGLPTGVQIALAGGANGAGAAGTCSLVENNACVTTGLTFSSATVTAPTTGAGANNNRTFVSFPGATNPDIASFITSVRVLGTVSIVAGTTLPVAAGTVTVQASLGQTGTAYSVATATLGQVIQPSATGVGSFPRYERTLRPATPLTVVNIGLAQTYLMLPFAQRIVATGVGNTWDTGIAISNTTSDNALNVFGSTTNTAVAQAGPVRVDFFPTNGTACDYTTASGSPGTGLTTGTGTLASGKTYIALLSELITASAATAAGTGHVPCAAALASSFQGYLIVSTSFTNAHGEGYVTNAFSGGTFTSATDVLVIPPPITSATFGRNNTAGESLAK
jgi:hypothetical protein